MEVVELQVVKDFVADLNIKTRKSIYVTVLLLEKFGHDLHMPDAKPVGKGLWELRLSSEGSNIRILYGFCDNTAILLLGFKKQQSAIRRNDLKLALKRLKKYCS